MKHLLYFCLWLSLLLMMFACENGSSVGDGVESKDDTSVGDVIEDRGELIVSKLKEDNPLIYGTGGEVDLPILISAEWDVNLLDVEDAEWLIFEKKGSLLNIKTIPNNSGAEREASLRFTSGESVQTITIRQLRNIFYRETIGVRSIRNEVKASYAMNTFSTVVVILPLPTSNLYQDVSDMKYEKGDILMADDGVTPYLYRCINSNLDIPASGQEWLSEEFSITNYRVYVDFDAITSYVDIDADSEPYLLYMGKSGNIIDPDCAAVQQLAESLWSQSDGDIVRYARLSYEWVACNMLYLNPNTGLHPVSDILANGGGDCGNQATIFNSLMRNRGIPARHIVMMRTDGTYHVRSEFYLAGYGWIPVDVNAKNMVPDGDFFGVVESDEIVVNSNINLKVKLIDQDYETLTLLQNFAYWYWWSGETDFSIAHCVTEI